MKVWIIMIEETWGDFHIHKAFGTKEKAKIYKEQLDKGEIKPPIPPAPWLDNPFSIAELDVE